MRLETGMAALSRLARAGALLLALLLLLPAIARAQDIPAPPVPLNVDARGVDLVNGDPIVSGGSLAIGPAGPHGLQFSRQWANNYGWRIEQLPTITGSSTAPVVSFGGHSVPFTGGTSSYTPVYQDGSTLSYNSGNYIFTGSDGTEIDFSYMSGAKAGVNALDLALATQITWPDGTVWHFYWESQTFLIGVDCEYDPWGGCNPIYDYEAFARLASITSSTGYQIKLAGGSGTPFLWTTVSGATAINNAVEYCDPIASCTLSDPWPQVSYAYDTNGYLTGMTDPDGLTTAYSYSTTYAEQLTGVRAPGESGDTTTYGYPTGGSKVQTVTAGGGTWSYAYYSGYTTVADPNSNVTSTSYDAGGRITAVVQPGGTIATHYAWCAGAAGCPSGLLQSVTLPEGNQVAYAYDARGNVTGTTNIAKAGSGLANIVTGAAYPPTCANAKTCNQPSSTTDAGGNVTSYTYDAGTGLVTKVEAPAATTGGARPTVNTLYAVKQSRYLVGPSSWANASVTVPVETNTCRTAAACDGTANEARTILAYPASTTANNLQPTSVQQASGDGALSSTTTLAYDDEGRVATVDGPLSGADDEAAVFYDADGNVTGEIGADPDGAGGNPRPAVRYTYNAKGQLAATESGTVTALTQAAVTGMTASFKQVSTYDANRRLATQAQVATSGATQYSIVQYGYDALGRADCTAVRMNAPTTTTALPASACTAMTAGSYGPDRIGETLYTALGQVASVHSGVGTALAQTTAAYSYTGNGRIASVTDAGGGTTTYTYDGFDRPTETHYPDKATGAANPADYEALAYGNTAGNELGRVTGWRSRLGESFAFAHDLLGRTTVATVPDRSGLDASFTRDVYYSYDVASDMTSARFDSINGNGIVTAYDAFGRATSTTDSMFATPKTIGYAYDVAGNRVTVTHPDATAFTYVYDSAGRLTGIKLGSTQLAGFTFNILGQLGSETRYATAPGMSYTYDAAGRLATLAITGGGSNAVSWSYAWNPAGEEVSTTRDNDLYAFTGAANVSRNYTPNHLDQYGTVGADTITHDANGNLANDSHTAFTYDPQNMLVSASGGNTATLHYDPLGRLFSVASGASTTQFLYDGDQLVGEYNGSGTLLDRYVFGGGGDDPILAYDGTTTANTALRQLYADRLGSIVLTTGYTGTLTGRAAYDDWGIPNAANAGVGAAGQGRFQYTGQAWLPEVGLFHYKARMYSPVLGRFMQTDPIGYGDGMNMYRYVGNNPVNGVDPTGMDGFDPSGLECANASAPTGDLSIYACVNGQWQLRWDHVSGGMCEFADASGAYGAPQSCLPQNPFTTTIDCSNGACNNLFGGNVPATPPWPGTVLPALPDMPQNKKQWVLRPLPACPSENDVNGSWDLSGGADLAAGISKDQEGTTVVVGAGEGAHVSVDTSIGGSLWSWSSPGYAGGAAVIGTASFGFGYGLSLTSVISATGNSISLDWSFGSFGESGVAGVGAVAKTCHH